MNKHIYITYCSKQKIKNWCNKSTLFFPSELYTSHRIQEFIFFCEKRNYNWAIFSDLYGLVSKNDKIKWYDKSPDLVTKEEYDYLLNVTIKKLKDYSNIIFFYNAETFHSLYKQLVNDLKKYKYNIKLVDKLEIDDEEQNQ